MILVLNRYAMANHIAAPSRAKGADCASMAPLAERSPASEWVVGRIS
jgi:hypothetical protein